MKGAAVPSFRADIQGLRAIAVLLVLVFHVWPQALGGGYVGVDVFFVISGYLITGQLFRELSSQGRVALPSFYERRIRRLLPAASLTLVAVALGTRVWLPRGVWKDTAQELFASAFYVENLLLVRKSVDYLAQDAEPSAVQHYWSLSVEEQFYILWPLIIIMVGALAARFARANVAVLLRIALGVVCIASFGASLLYAAHDPAPGYFLTTTRLWELGLGGLLALAPGEQLVPRRLASAVGFVAVLGILLSAVFYSVELPFPGHRALLPTVSAALLIAARSSEESWLGKLLGLGPLQYFGEISYSLYLWHWPVIVVYPYIVGRNIEFFADGVTVVAASVGLAHLAKVLVEDRFRHPPEQPGRSRVVRGLVLGVVATALVSAGALWLARSVPKPRPVRPVSGQARKYPGAEAFVHGAPVEAGLEIRPAPETASTDRGPAYGTGKRKSCFSDVTGTDLQFCTYGEQAAPFHVAVVGDSHAIHWFPAFERLAKKRKWRVTGLAKNACAFADITVVHGNKTSAPRPYDECRTWSQAALAWLLETRPSLVILSMSPTHKVMDLSAEESQPLIAQGIVRLTEKLTQAGLHVGLIKHTPWHEENVPACMSKPDATVQGCSGSRAQAVRDGAINIASRLQPSLQLLDFDDAFCRNETCPVVIGNVLVHSDRHHMTATYARTLAEVLDERIKKAFPSAR